MDAGAANERGSRNGAGEAAAARVTGARWVAGVRRPRKCTHRDGGRAGNAGTLRDVRRFLFSPRWLAGHVLVLALFVACLWLGRWQWDRAHHAGGGPQNFGYALQWPLFAVFGLFAWVRIIRIERARSENPAAELVPLPAAPPAWHDNPVFADDGDEELAEYNRRLAKLHARDQRTGR